MKTGSPPKSDRRHFPFRADEKLLRRAHLLARFRGVSLNSLLEHVLRTYLDRQAVLRSFPAPRQRSRAGK